MAWSISTMPWCLSQAKKCPKKVAPPVHATCMSCATPSSQARERHDDLERRAGCELRLDGLVQQRMVRVGDDLVPVGSGEADGELVGIEGWAGDHGENLAGVRIHRDYRAVLALHGLFGGHLDVQVDGELEVLAGDGEGLAELAELFAVAVDDDIAAAIHAAKESVVGGFDAGSADDVAGRVEGVLVVVGKHLLGDFADVADEMGGEAIAGVEAALLIEGLEFGELVAMGRDEGLLVGGDVLLEGNGLVVGSDLVAAKGGVDLVDGDVEALRDQGQVGVRDL